MLSCASLNLPYGHAIKRILMATSLVIPAIVHAEESLDYYTCNSSNVCWLGSGTSDWGTGSNWSSTSVPSGAVAEFSTSSSTVSISSSQPPITGMQFDSGVGAFTFTMASGGALTMTSTGIVVESGGTAPAFNLNAGSSLTLSGTATLGGASVTTSAASGSTAAGTLYFQGNSSGGTASVTNNGVVDLSAVTSGALSVSISGSGNIFLGDNTLTLSSANNPTISGVIADGGAAGGTGGSLVIAGGGTIYLTGMNTYTGTTTVESSNQLNIGTNSNTTASLVSDVTVQSGGFANIYGTLSGSLTNANQTLMYDGGVISGAITNTYNLYAYGGSITGNINNSSTALYGVTITGSSSIVNTTTTNSGDIYVSGDATITSTITNSGASTIIFSGSSLDAASQSTIINNSTITSGYGVDISGFSGSSMTIGSLSGSGTVNLGANNLQLGSFNLNDTISGIISDGNAGGALTKNGTGTLTLSGNNTYMGATTVKAGTLQVNGSINNSALTNSATTNFSTTTAVTNTITNTGTINFQNATAYTGSSITNTGGTINFQNTSSAGGTINNLPSGTITFQNTSSAGSALIANSGILTFEGSSSAGTAALYNSSNSKIFFAGSNTNAASSASITNNGLVDISQSSTAITFGNYNDVTGASINLGANQLTLNLFGSRTLRSTISGVGGSLILEGGYNTTFTAVNTYTGTTEVKGSGTLLAVSTGGSFVSDITIDTGAQADISGTLSGSVTNNGTQFLLENGGKISGYLTNTTSFDELAGGSITGNITNTATTGYALTINGTVNNTSTANSGYIYVQNGGAISSTITNTGASTLVFRGSNTQAGSNAIIINNSTIATPSFYGVDVSGVTSSSIAIGSLSGSGSVNLGTTKVQLGGLNLNDTISGNISGTGSGVTLTKNGTGTLTLDGINNYTGSTTVAMGALQVGDSSHPLAAIVSPTTINAGATLQGYGTVSSSGISVTNNGTLMPGGGASAVAGTLNISGAYTQGSTGTYLINIDSNANASNTAVTGVANLSGYLYVPPTYNPLAFDHLYTILTAGGGRTGTFTLEPSASGFLTQQVIYSMYEVQYLLTYDSAGILDSAQTPNQLAVAENILATHGTPAINLALDGLSTNDQLSGFLNELSGATYANQQVMLAQLDREFANQMARRIDAYQSCVTQDIRYYKKKKKNSFECNDQLAWFELYGGNDQIKSTAGISGLNINNFGLTVGGETPFANKTTVLGGGAGYLDYRGETRGYESANQNGDLYQFGVYLRQQFATNGRLGGAVSYTVANNNQNSRYIDNVVGAGQILSEYDTGLFSSQGRLSYRFQYVNGLNWQPIVGAIYQRVNAYSFDEEGLPGFELQVTEKAYNSFRSQVGAEIDFAVNSYHIAPFVMLAWEHEFRDQYGQFDASFIGVTEPFHINGVELGREILTVQAGLGHVQRFNWEFDLSFEGRFSSGFSQLLTVAQLAYF